MNTNLLVIPQTDMNTNLLVIPLNRVADTKNCVRYEAADDKIIKGAISRSCSLNQMETDMLSRKQLDRYLALVQAMSADLAINGWRSPSEIEAELATLNAQRIEERVLRAGRAS